MRRSFCSLPVSMPSTTSSMLAMPSSISLRATIGISTDSPAVACTSVFSPPFSFSILAMADATVCVSVPGCMVARP